MAGLSIDIGANTKAAATQIKTLGDNLDDVVDSLDDVGRGAKGSGDKLEQALKDAERQAKKTDSAVDDIGGHGTGSMGKLKESASEVTSEIGQNLGEAVSSVRGNLGDLAQVGQDTLGGLAATVAGTGPAGLVGAAALAAGATGLGLITARLQEQQQEADELAKRLGAAYQEAQQAGNDYLGLTYFIKESQDLMYNPDRAKEWNKVQETQKATGLDLNTVIKANAGDLDSIAQVQGRINDLKDAEIQKNIDADKTANYSRQTQDMENYWNTMQTGALNASATAKQARDSTNQFWEDAINGAKGATVKTDEFGNKLYELPTGEKVVIEADTGDATDDVSKFKGDVSTVPQTVTTTVNIEDRASAQLDALLRRMSGKTINVGINAVGPRGATWQ